MRCATARITYGNCVTMISTRIGVNIRNGSFCIFGTSCKFTTASFTTRI